MLEKIPSSLVLLPGFHVSFRMELLATMDLRLEMLPAIVASLHIDAVPVLRTKSS
jgi:hypothetical protein